MYTEDTVPAFKLIAIGIGNIKDPAKIKSFVGEDGYYGKRMDEILDPKFIKELSVCDSKLHILSR